MAAERRKLSEIFRILIGDSFDEWRRQMRLTMFTSFSDWMNHLLCVHEQYCPGTGCKADTAKGEFCSRARAHTASCLTQEEPDDIGVNDAHQLRGSPHEQRSPRKRTCKKKCSSASSDGSPNSAENSIIISGNSVDEDLDTPATTGHRCNRPRVANPSSERDQLPGYETTNQFWSDDQENMGAGDSSDCTLDFYAAKNGLRYNCYLDGMDSSLNESPRVNVPHYNMRKRTVSKQLKTGKPDSARKTDTPGVENTVDSTINPDTHRGDQVLECSLPTTDAFLTDALPGDERDSPFLGDRTVSKLHSIGRYIDMDFIRRVDGDKYRCNFCALTTKYSNSIQSHVKFVHLIRESQHRCHICHNLFKRAKDFRKHFRRFHGNCFPGRTRSADKHFLKPIS